MSPILIQTDSRMSAAERFAQYRDQVAVRQPVPIDLRIARTDGFASQILTRELGAMTVSTLRSRSRTSYVGDRTYAMIRRSDPEAYRLVINVRGESRSSHGEYRVQFGAGDMVLYDTSSPFEVWRGVREDERLTDTWLMVTMPRTLVPLRPQAMRRILGGRLPGRTGVGALLTSLVKGVARGDDLGPGQGGFYLSTAVADLLTALLVEELDESDVTAAPESRRRVLLRRLQAFIEQRLGDPELTPATVAAAHYISVRSLHRAFAEHGLTVSGWIRARRLDRCRRDLLDPALSAQPIHLIAARWGFPQQAHFSRLFRVAYDESPIDYRARARPTAR